MDISNLTSLINALRAETQEDSITPESLGALLQKIVDLLGSAANDTTVQQLVQWQRIEQQCSAVITSLVQGADDRNNLLLNVDVVNPSTSLAHESVITLKQATTERAGIMRAQQVTDLNWCRNRLQEIVPQLVTLQQSITSAANAANRAEQTALEGWQRMVNIEYDVNNIQAQVNAIDTAGGTTGTPAYFISLEAVKGKLFVRGKIDDIMNAGLVPYIFRYSIKKHRVRPKKSYERRKGPSRIGWHVFYGEGKIKVTQGGGVTIMSHYEDSTKGKYWDDPTFLFSEPVFHEGDSGELSMVNLAYGKKTYNVRYCARKFRFGIAFGLPIPERSNFYFHLLRTNIAVIKVRTFYNSDTEEVEFKWSR